MWTRWSVSDARRAGEAWRAAAGNRGCALVSDVDAARRVAHDDRRRRRSARRRTASATGSRCSSRCRRARRRRRRGCCGCSPGRRCKYENQLCTARQPPDPPGRDELADRDPRRVEAVHEGLHEVDARALGRPRPCARRRRRSSPAASRTGRACRPARRRWSTRRGGGSAAGCRRRRRPGRRGAPRTSHAPSGCRGRPATGRAALRRATRWRRPRMRPALRMPGMTFFVAMCGRREDSPAQPYAHRSALPRASVLTWPRRCTSLAHTFGERNTNPDVDAAATSSDSAARRFAGRT